MSHTNQIDLERLDGFMMTSSTAGHLIPESYFENK